MAQNSGDILRSLDNFQKRSLHIQAQPFVYAADKDKRLEILNERTAAEKKEREEWLAARAAEAEMTKAERSKLQEQLKLIKAEKEKEKLERKQAAKAQRAIEKEKADIEKEEKRLKAIEEAMLKREQQKEKAMEQAKKKAEQRAIQELRREEQALERDAKIRRSIQERAEKEKARREIAEMTKQVYEERRKELALEAEVKRKEQEEVEAQARMDAERKAAKARAEREAYEKGIRDFRMAAMKLEVDRKLEDIAAKRAAREVCEAQPITPTSLNMARTVEWAASQTKPNHSGNPRLAAGHPNANPLRSTYVEDDDDLPQDQIFDSRDPRLSHEVNNTLLRLVQQAKERIEVEKAQASKSGASAPIRDTPAASARAFHQGSVKPVPAGRPDVFEDSSPFAVDDNQRDSLQAETFDCEKDGDGQCETSSTDV